MKHAQRTRDGDAGGFCIWRQRCPATCLHKAIDRSFLATLSRLAAKPVGLAWGGKPTLPVHNQLLATLENRTCGAYQLLVLTGQSGASMAKQGRETRYFCFWTRDKTRGRVRSLRRAPGRHSQPAQPRCRRPRANNPQQASRFLTFLPDVGMPTTRRHAPATQRP